ncbi:DEAD/DEAH box helicase family protein [Lentzea sp. NPDC034063]|uniref:DEAD/DEAH box helicase n=1 Tax=unclassified Lentzea TaxID=2643253 RepID=UPI0033F300F5
MLVATDEVWGRTIKVARNQVRQLLVPESTLEVHQTDTGSVVSNQFGVWPAVVGGSAPTDGPLTAHLDVTDPASPLLTWCGSRELHPPEAVSSSFEGAIEFRKPGVPGSLRRPQLGALHSVIGYWSTGVTEPGVVVMPTGTGKTETMLAVMLAERPERLLVLVPTLALRDQVAGKFESLGILQEKEIAARHALRPCVARFKHGIKDVEDAAHLLSTSNVIVATPHALNACSDEALKVILQGCSHLMVDEAHHAPAPSWKRVVEAFSDRRVLLFTATPFREDGKSVPGRTIYRFPLREAQRDEYFTTIDYQAVVAIEGTDEVLADLAVTRLREDLAAGYNHILMARAKSVARAESLLKLYEAKAGDLHPAVLHEKVAAADRRAIHEQLKTRDCRIVVCVDMLGEGFDLPALKVAALHDVKKSLSPMIQFIGRFTRARADATDLGTASVFVARDPSIVASPLRDLLREDADWNLLLRDMTERVTQAAEAVSTFDNSFSGGPEDVATALLEPKMSAIAHTAPTQNWAPEAALVFYGPDNVLDSSIALGAESSIAWFVVEHRDEVAWGDVKTLEQVMHELIVMYFDREHRILYVHSSMKNGDYADLAEAVLGAGAKPIKGSTTFRVLAHLDRLIPTNIGLLDARDHFNRFSMHVGSDVLHALDALDQQGKTQTHISTSGFSDGDRITISAALSGRFWSTRTAPSLSAWRHWCDAQGTKLLDSSIDLAKVLGGFIVPQDLTERPELVLLAAEWDWRFYLGTGPELMIRVDDSRYHLTDVDIRVDDFSTSGPFVLSLVTPAWEVPYHADFTDSGLIYSPLGNDAQIETTRTSTKLQQWINENKPMLLLENDRMITSQDKLLEPRYDLRPFPRERLTALDWAGVDMSVESQGPERRPDSIQAYMVRHLLNTQQFNLLIDDDGAGEAADLVGLRVDEQELHITLVHCKYSSKKKAGARLDDLYELCGQAVRGAKWRQHGAMPLLRHLDKRAQRYYQRTDASPFMVGALTDLYQLMSIAPQLRPRFHNVLAQPGLSGAAATNEHLRVLAGAESYVHAVTKGTFEVYCSR